MRADDMYAFEIAVHGRPPDLAAGGRHVDDLGEWPVLAVPHAALSLPMDADFDASLERLAGLERLYVEPDGSFVWTSPAPAAGRGAARERWQVDGNAFEKDGRVLLVDLKGACPAVDFDRLAAAFGWPGQQLMMQLVRPAVFLEEADFRGHARARWIAANGQGLQAD